MTNEELFIRNKMGQKNPFVVPEGYFDQLADSVMSQLPQKEAEPTVTLVRRLRPVLLAAACICLFLFGTFVYFGSEEHQQSALQAQASATDTENYVDEAADYAMLDNHEIYLCLMNE